MNKFGSLFGTAILALASLPVSAGLVTYSDYDAWKSAVSGDIITELFDAPSTPVGNNLDITFDGGIRSVASAGTSTLNQVDVAGSEYKGRVGIGTFSEEITWTLPETLGFFGLFRDVHRLEVIVDGFTEMVYSGSPPYDGGFGITSDAPFSSISWKLFNGASGGMPDNDLFYVEEFSYVGTSVPPVDPGFPVPAPPALWLFGIGLLGLVGFNRRSKAV